MPLNPIPSWPGTALDSLPDPTTTTYEDDDGYEIDYLLQKHNAILESAEAKLGLGATTPDALHKTLKATPAGTGDWGYHGAVKLAEASGTGASANIDLTSINQNFRALRLHILGRSTNAGTLGAAVKLTFETSPTAGAYDAEIEIAAAAAVTAAENIGAVDYIQVGNVPSAGADANLHSSIMVDIGEYTNTSTLKTVIAQGLAAFTIASGGIKVFSAAGVWESTAAIATIRLALNAGSWTTTSRVTLWGLP